MTEYEQIPQPEKPEPAAPPASQDSPSEPDAAESAAGATVDAEGTAEKAGAERAWSEVVESLDELGNAVTQWARAVKDDPRNRERASELKSGLEGLGKQLGDMVDTASKSDIGQQIGGVASKTGDAVVDVARSVGDAVGPHVAGAFRSIADALRGAADRMGQPSEGAVPPPPDSAPEPPPAPPAPEREDD